MKDERNVVLTYARTLHVESKISHYKEVGECYQINTATMSLHQRLNHLALMPSGAGDMVYGLFNAQCLEKCGLFPNEVLPDRLLIGKIGLFGNIKCVPEAIRYRRVETRNDSYKNPLAKQFSTLFSESNYPPLPYLSHVTHYLKEIIADSSLKDTPEQTAKLLYLALMHFQRQLNNYKQECIIELENSGDSSDELSAFVQAVLDRRWRVMYQDYAGLQHKFKDTLGKLRYTQDRLRALTEEYEAYRASSENLEERRTVYSRTERPLDGINISEKKSKSLSIIICTYNRKALLQGCLEALVPQIDSAHADDIEVIVVANNCTDDTSSLLYEYQAKYPWLKGTTESQQGLSHARNRGALEANAGYLCYLDDDGKPGEQYISSVLDVINCYRPDIMGGPVYPYYTTPKPKWFHDDLEIRRHAISSGFHDCPISGGNFIIRSELLEELGMFSINFGMVGDKIWLGEERALIERYREILPPSRRRIFYSLESFIYHHVPAYKMNVGYIMKRGFASGKASVLVKREPFKRLPGAIMALSIELFFELPKTLVKANEINPSVVRKFRWISILFGKIFQYCKSLLIRY